MRHWNRIVCKFGLVALFILFFTSYGYCADDTQRGQLIAQEMDQRDQGWKNCSVTVFMTLGNAHGETSRRELRSYFLEVNETGAGDQGLIVFDSPKDISGTALLSHSIIQGPDKQWLYLPALKRVKRISSSNKSGPFVGSEFSYEDLLPQNIEKFDYKWIKDETVDGLDCFVVERYPVYESSGYSKQVVWIDKVEYRPMKIDFYDRKNSLLKTLIYSNYHNYLDEIWRASTLTMANLQTKKTTLLEFDRYIFRGDLDSGSFSPDRLKRIR